VASTTDNSYEVLSNLAVSRDLKERHIAIVSTVHTEKRVHKLAQQLADDLLGDNRHLLIFVYLVLADVKFHGYVAKIEIAPDSAPQVIFDNDVALRYQLYKTFS
jgi:hypothetical protein